MRGFFYVLLEFLRANLRQTPTLLGWAVAIALVLASATALFFLPLDSGGSAVVGQHLFVLTLDPLLSELEINRLAWQIAAWPETVRLNFRFPGETDPEPLWERALVVEARPEGRDAVLARFAKLAGLRQVTALERRAVQPGFPPRARIASLAVLSLGAAASLILGRRATRRAGFLWGKEREILRLAGMSPLFWQGPLLVLGVLVGLGGAGLFVLGLGFGLGLAPAEPAWKELAQRVPWLTGMGLPAGALLGLLTSLLRPYS